MLLLCAGVRLGRIGEDGNSGGDASYSLSLRPEGPTSELGPPLEGLAYPQHRPKSPPNMHHGLATLAHAAFNRNPIHYPNSSQASQPQPSQSSNHSTSNVAIHSASNMMSHSRHRPPSAPYTPVQLPRADIKPYHESYFTDSKPPVSSVKVSCVKCACCNSIELVSLDSQLYLKLCEIIVLLSGCSIKE